MLQWLRLRRTQLSARVDRQVQEQERDLHLIAQASEGSVKGLFSDRVDLSSTAIATLIVNLKAAMIEQQDATNRLTERIRTLTAWLLVFTVVILLLTAAQVWIGVRR